MTWLKISSSSKIFYLSNNLKSPCFIAGTICGGLIFLYSSVLCPPTNNKWKFEHKFSKYQSTKYSIIAVSTAFSDFPRIFSVRVLLNVQYSKCNCETFQYIGSNDVINICDVNLLLLKLVTKLQKQFQMSQESITP